MSFSRSFRIMQQVEKSLFHNSRRNGGIQENSTYTYETTIEALNSLQSNAAYLKNVRSTAQVNRVKRPEMSDFLIRSGMNFESLDTLSVIHVTGTKGKGSTCAYCESILRHHGVKTGFFSSPHLVNVVERIKINGSPIKKSKFSSHFWEVYNNLLKTKAEEMPIYFEMTVLVALKIFMAENVDVAVLEVGIGGEYDSTNFLRVVPIAGITSLGLDHTSLLGNTLESIAWHKSGIMKKGAKVFTVPQKPEAMNVLKDRSIEKQCELEIVEETDNQYIRDCVRPPFNILGTNASLAVKLAETWLEKNGKQISMEKIREGLRNCYWPGRYQVFHTNKIDFYLDGAHTDESLKHCLNWFRETTKNSVNKKALMFNNTGDRNSESQLIILNDYNFDVVLFVPNTAISEKSADSVNFNFPETEQLVKCSKHHNIWMEINKGNNTQQKVILKPTIADAFATLGNDKYDLLVTGSLHLVGATLSLIDPDLQGVEYLYNYNENNKVRNIY